MRGRADIAIDPGKIGALGVLGPDCSARMAMCWTRFTRKKRTYFKIYVWTPDKTWEIEEPYIFSRLLTKTMPVIIGSCGVPLHMIDLTVEGVFVGKNPRDSVNLAFDAGCLVGPLEYTLGRAAENPKAIIWRKLILGLGNRTTTEAAKAASIKYIPLKVKGLDVALEWFNSRDKVKSVDHITDMFGVALWRRAVRIAGGSAGQ